MQFERICGKRLSLKQRQCILRNKLSRFYTKQLLYICHYIQCGKKTITDTKISFINHQTVFSNEIRPTSFKVYTGP